jgi:hypothetical protein
MNLFYITAFHFIIDILSSSFVIKYRGHTEVILFPDSTQTHARKDGFWVTDEEEDNFLREILQFIKLRESPASYVDIRPPYVTIRHCQLKLQAETQSVYVIR